MADKSSEDIAVRYAPVCFCNQEPMKIASVSPKVGLLAELWRFRCHQCGHVETIEARKGAR
jgi:hypothetical protein